jgi:DNA-directed RNA polymerase subunit RPC12/RpoP
MINFTCSACGQALLAEETSAGSETSCPGCGAANLVPIDLECEDWYAAPDVQTITVEELQALRKKA